MDRHEVARSIPERPSGLSLSKFDKKTLMKALRHVRREDLKFKPLLDPLFRKIVSNFSHLITDSRAHCPSEYGHECGPRLSREFDIQREVRRALRSHDPIERIVNHPDTHASTESRTTSLLRVCLVFEARFSSLRRASPAGIRRTDRCASSKCPRAQTLREWAAQSAFDERDPRNA
jgi:hypothetical protein